MHTTFTAWTEKGDSATVDLADTAGHPIVITIKGKTGGFSYIYLTRELAAQISPQLADRVKTAMAGRAPEPLAIPRIAPIDVRPVELSAPEFGGFGLSEGPATDAMRRRAPEPCAVAVMQAAQCGGVADHLSVVDFDPHNLSNGDIE